jgi:protein O-mannosyl-transferase
MPEHKPQVDDEVTFKGLFLPITTKKAIVYIFLIGFIVFFNALFGHFVWDDIGYIVENPAVHTVNLPVLFGPHNAFNDAGYYRPLSATYFAVIYSVFGSQPFFFHLIQISIHIINSILIFILFKRFFMEKLALFLSIIFLIHPINVESVSYIGASQSVILMMFGMLAFLVNLQKIPKLKKTILIFILLLLSLLTKEAGVLFVLIIFCYQWLIERKHAIYYLGLSAATVITYLCIRFFIGNIYLFKIPFIPMAQLSFSQRLMNIPSIIFYYVKTMVYPIDLIIEQQWAFIKPTLTNFYLPLAVVTGLLILLFVFVVKLYKSNKLKFNQLLFFSIWTIVGVSFLLQLFPLDMTVADRWFYFPFVGLLGIIGILTNYFANFKKYANGVIILGLIIILLLTTRTIIRNSDWQDTLTLLMHDTKIQTNFDNENNLGMALDKAGDTRQALIHFQKSVLLNPFELNMTNTGGAYLKLNNPKLAKPYLIKALTSKRYSALSHKHELSVYINYGTYLTFYDKPSSSAEFLKTAIKDYPTSGKIYYLLAVSRYLLGEKQQAVSDIEKAYALNPTPQVEYAYKQMHNNLPLAIKK